MPTRNPKRDVPKRDMKKVRELFKSCLAVAAPALVPLVIIISTDALTLRRIAPLDRWGYLAISVVLFTLSYLLWKRRWWAGLPSMAVFCLAAAIFSLKAVRPLWAYYRVNSFQGEEGGLMPFLMVSPSLVLVVLAVTLAWFCYKGIRTARGGKPDSVPMKTWGILIVWMVVLLGDVVYQEVGWRYVKNPDDLVIRLCLDDRAQQREAEKMLLEKGASAVPALRLGLAAPGPALACLREQSRSMLDRMGVQVNGEGESK